MEAHWHPVMSMLAFVRAVAQRSSCQIVTMDTAHWEPAAV